MPVLLVWTNSNDLVLFYRFVSICITFYSLSIYLLSAISSQLFVNAHLREKKLFTSCTNYVENKTTSTVFPFSCLKISCLKLMTICDVEIVHTVLAVVFTVTSTWCSSCCEPLTGLYPMFPSPWSWRWRGSATWLSKLWLKTRRPCWWVEPERPPLPLQAPPAQVSKNMGRTHTRSCSTHFSI